MSNTLISWRVVYIVFQAFQGFSKELHNHILYAILLPSNSDFHIFFYHLERLRPSIILPTIFSLLSHYTTSCKKKPNCAFNTFLEIPLAIYPGVWLMNSAFHITVDTLSLNFLQLCNKYLHSLLSSLLSPVVSSMSRLLIICPK